jgi:hypothetical protein
LTEDFSFGGRILSTFKEPCSMQKFVCEFCAAILFLCLSSCNNAPTDKGASPDSSLLAGPQPAYLYYNGKILGGAGDSIPYAEALVERSGRVVYLGSMEEAVKEAGDACVRVNLEGKSIVPGFVGAKGVPLNYAK